MAACAFGNGRMDHFTDYVIMYLIDITNIEKKYVIIHLNFYAN